jgi:hypothetical protein
LERQHFLEYLLDIVLHSSLRALLMLVSLGLLQCESASQMSFIDPAAIDAR